MNFFRLTKWIQVACIFSMLFLINTGVARSQSNDAEIPKIVEKDDRFALIVDGQPFFIMGGQAHNSSAWPGMLPHVWSAIDALHANTLEVPIYWEQIEPQPGKFNFSLIDTLLVQARDRDKYLVLLWFATWKNGSNHYMPEWIKLDAKKYPNLTANNGKLVDSPSPLSTEAMEADSKAFAAVMRHLKEADSQHTVIMVQVENEPGSWYSVRDYSTKAQKLFDGSVPKELLNPDVLKALNKPVVSKGTWQEVFGNDADEYFHAWSVARYIEFVAAAGKAENPLPLYVNGALRDPLGNPRPTTYESGGPTDNVIPVWKAAAPSIDLLAPDIYLSGSERILKVLELYSRSDNALFIPEVGMNTENIKYLYKVLAHGGIGFSPFGIDNNGEGTDEDSNKRLEALGREYSVMGKMMRELAKWAFEGKIKAVVEQEDHSEQTMDLGSWQAVVTFGGGVRGMQPNDKPVGKGMVIELGENEFLLLGTNCRFTFKPLGNNAGKEWQYIKVEEGTYTNGKFDFLRIRNGDETDWGGPHIGAEPKVLKATLSVR